MRGETTLARIEARWGLLALTLVMALTLAGCGGASSQSVLAGHASGKTAAQATATPAPVPTLPWRKITLPVELNSRQDGFAFSPVNGRDAWACAPQSSGGSYQVWRTQDAAATWQPVSVITPSAQQATTACYLQADQADVNAVVATFSWGVPNSNGPTGEVGYVSDDGGATWARLPGGVIVGQMVTIAGVTYATLMDTAHNNGGQTFVVSANHLGSWRDITPSASTPRQIVSSGPRPLASFSGRRPTLAFSTTPPTVARAGQRFLHQRGRAWK